MGGLGEPALSQRAVIARSRAAPARLSTSWGFGLLGRFVIGDLLHEDRRHALRSGGRRPRGTLRISAPLVFGHIALPGLTAGFVRAYPEVQVEVVASPQVTGIRRSPSPPSKRSGVC